MTPYIEIICAEYEVELAVYGDYIPVMYNHWCQVWYAVWLGGVNLKD